MLRGGLPKSGLDHHTCAGLQAAGTHGMGPDIEGAGGSTGPACVSGPSAPGLGRRCRPASAGVADRSPEWEAVAAGPGSRRKFGRQWAAPAGHGDDRLETVPVASHPPLLFLESRSESSPPHRHCFLVHSRPRTQRGRQESLCRQVCLGRDSFCGKERPQEHLAACISGPGVAAPLLKSWLSPLGPEKACTEGQPTA